MSNYLNSIAEHWWTWQVAMLWQTAVLIGILWIVDVAIRKWAHPQVRYALWMLVLVKLLIPPTWTSPASITSHIPDVANRAATVMEQADNSAAAQAARSVTQPSRSHTEPLPAGRPRSQVVQQGQETIAAGATPGIKSSPPAPVASQHSEDGKGQSREAGRGSLSWKTYAMFTWLAGMLLLSAWLLVRLSGLRREHQIALPLQSGGAISSLQGESFYCFTASSSSSNRRSSRQTSAQILTCGRAISC